MVFSLKQPLIAYKMVIRGWGNEGLCVMGQEDLKFLLHGEAPLGKMRSQGYESWFF